MYAFYKKYEYLIVALLVAVPYIYAAPFWDGNYRDTDCYIHAWRTYDLMLNKNWAEEILMKSNYPFGEVIHYTRLMDVMWLLLALPLTLFYSLKDAVFNAGLIFQPLIAIMSACAIVWTFRPCFNPFLRLFAVVLFFCQPITAQLYVFSRPDHHTIVVFFTFMLMGCFLRYIKNPDIKYMKYAGVFSGMMLWTSVEGLLVAYAILTPMLVLWILEKRYLKEAKIFILYFLSSSAAFLLINPPYEGLFHPDNGRISILMLTIIGFTYLSILAAERLEQKEVLTNWFKRGLSIGVPALFGIGVVLLIFGYNTVFGNPFTPEIKAWYSSVAELTPAGNNPVLFKTFALPSTLAVIVVILFFTPKQKDFLFFSGFPLFFFTTLVYVSIRFSQHSSVFIIFPILACIDALLTRFCKRYPPTQNTIYTNLTCFLFVCAAFVLLMYTGKETLKGMANAFAYNTHDYIPYISKKPGSILTRIFDGSEIIWTMERPVISTPNHRNIDGIVDTYNTFFNNDMGEVKKLLQKRQVSTIMIPPNVMNLNPLYPPRNDDFAVRLINGRALPCGITLASDLPVKMQSLYVLYHVDFDNCPP